MTYGVSLSVAETAAILAGVLVLAVLSSFVYLRRRTDVPQGRRSLVLFWGCLAVTWLVAVVAAVAMQSTP
jgi:hypothetical protein